MRIKRVTIHQGKLHIDSSFACEPRSHLEYLTASMNSEQKQQAVQILKDADIAHRLKGITIQKELKCQRDKHKGKLKQLLTALAKHPDTIDGVDWLFENHP